MVKYTIMNRKCSFFLIIYLILYEKNLPGDCGYPDAGISQVGHFIIYNQGRNGFLIERYSGYRRTKMEIIIKENYLSDFKAQLRSEEKSALNCTQ